MIDNELIRTLLKLNSKSNKRIVLNDKFICEFTIPNTISDDKTYYFFSEFTKDNNCPMMSCYANVVVNNITNSERHIGKIYINYNLDLGNTEQYSLTLHITDNNETMFTVVKCIIEDM